ncbi:MAG TPA: lipoyl synthase [Candidatus Hydrogenedentes bacterium]|nr:lipoyl synthase [Candidatus Hydrogenedentota bacterium]HPG68710.1 lipoyl synthase [Candidatus Hydrogenedentota bacterium]
MTRSFPEWIRRPWGSGTAFGQTKALLGDLGVKTVCQSARCPNQGECWSCRTATFMILGTTCTRNCRFCSVRHGVPEPPAPDEPERVAEAVARLGLRHAVVTSVTRDDVEDGGAGHFRRTIEAIRARNPEATVEVLTPDFNGARESVAAVLGAGPDVFGHNVETVERLYPVVRGAGHAYRRPLDVLRLARDLGGGTVVKSAFMLGLGETDSEVERTLADLLDAGCQAVCIGQYLQPTAAQCTVHEFVSPERFRHYEATARRMGFDAVVAGPFVRSSYRSGELLETVRGVRAASGEGEED